MYTTGMNNKPVVTELKVDEALLFQIMDAAEVLERRLDSALGKVGLSGAKARYSMPWVRKTRRSL
jgi:hypothetical protein